MEVGDLPPAVFPGASGLGIQDGEQTTLTQGEELAVGEEEGPASEDWGLSGTVRWPALIPVPGDASALEFDAAEAGIGFISAGEGVEETVVKDRGAPMGFEGGGFPHFIEGLVIGPDAEEHGADVVIRGRDEDEVVLDDGGDGVYGFVDGGAEPSAEAWGAGLRVKGDEALSHEAEQVWGSVDGGEEWA